GRGYETGTHSRYWRASAGKRDVCGRLATQFIRGEDALSQGDPPAKGTSDVVWLGEKPGPPPRREGVSVDLIHGLFEAHPSRLDPENLAGAYGDAAVGDVERPIRA